MFVITFQKKIIVVGSRDQLSNRIPNFVIQFVNSLINDLEMTDYVTICQNILPISCGVSNLNTQ